MTIPVQLSEEEEAALRERAKRDGISVEDAARCAVQEYLARGDHHDRVRNAVERVRTAHDEALRRLSE